MLSRKRKQTPPNIRFSESAPAEMAHDAARRRRISAASAGTSSLPSYLATVLPVGPRASRRALPLPSSRKERAWRPAVPQWGSAAFGGRQQKGVAHLAVDERLGLDLGGLVDILHRRHEMDVGPDEVRVAAVPRADAIARPGEAAEALSLLFVFLGGQQEDVALAERLAPAQQPFVAPGGERTLPHRLTVSARNA